MKRLITLFLVLLLSSGAISASGEVYDSFKGSFSMYDVATEMVVLKKIEDMTDPETGKVIIGDLVLNFDFFANALDEVEGYQVASVHFFDKDGNKYILDYYVDGGNVVKIMLLTKNGEVINKEIYPAKYPDKKEDCDKEKKQGK